MFLTALLTLATAAAPAAAATPAALAPIKLAAPGLSAVNIDEKVAAFFNDHLAQQYTLRGIRVTTPTEIGAMVGVERQKQLVGCSESSSSCIAEIADALGVDGVITGSLGKFGSTLQLNVKILRSAPGDMLDVFSLTASSEEQLLKQISDQAVRSADLIAGKLHRGLTTSASASAPASSSTQTSSAQLSQPQSQPADSTALPQNVISIGPLAALGGFFAVEYEHVLGSSFSVFVSPQYATWWGNGGTDMPTLFEVVGGARLYIGGTAPDGLFVEGRVGAGASSFAQYPFSVSGLLGFSSLRYRPLTLSFGLGVGYEQMGVLSLRLSPVFMTGRMNVGVAF